LKTKMNQWTSRDALPVSPELRGVNEGDKAILKERI